MNHVLEDARKLAHGTYDDVIVVEHRRSTGPLSGDAPADAPGGDRLAVHVVLEMPEGSRVIDTSQQYEIDGANGAVAPTVGASYRLIVAPAPVRPGSLEASPRGSLRYESMNR